MLEKLQREAVSNMIYRLANLSHYADFASRQGLSLEEVQVLLTFLGIKAGDLLNGPFQPKPLLDPSAPFGNSRFSDGTWPVFYGALEEATAESECLHHYAKDASGASGHAVYYSLLRCSFQGEAMDLRPKLPDWPDLTSCNYSFCQGLGKEASQMPLDSFLAPSAQRTSGTTTPIFFPTGLSNPAISATVKLSFDGAHPHVDRLT